MRPTAARERADSSVVTVTMPQQQMLIAPQVTRHGVIGHDGEPRLEHRKRGGRLPIYWWNGFRAVLLGSFGSATTSVQLTGLTPGARSYFLVEAFGGGMIGRFSWISVSTPAIPVWLKSALTLRT